MLSPLTAEISCILPFLLGCRNRLYGCWCFKQVIRTACTKQLIASSSHLARSENLINFLVYSYLAAWSEFRVPVLS